ncbi:MAG: glycosyltransferase family 2 protein [Erysipelotrichaceae bacterium]|nr:glycosyltransferase family 2 protein [Erysipelotrichaceae bacterium]
MDKTLVIIINYNSAVHTKECLESFDRQTRQDFDLMVVDNASNPDDVAMLERICNSRVMVVKSDVNLGFSGGNNIGLEYALKNKYARVLLINNDTTAPEDFMARLVEFSHLNPGAVISPQIRDYYNPGVISYGGGDVSFFKGGVNIYGVGEQAEGYQAKSQITFAHGCCMLIPLEVLEHVGMMPEEYFLYYEDTAYSRMITQKGYGIMYQNDNFILHKECVSTGKFSNLYQYYFTRNRLAFVKGFIPFHWKPAAYLFTTAFLVKKVVTNKFSPAIVAEAIGAFLKGQMGKR